MQQESPSHNSRILLVDDDPALRTFLAEELRIDGYEVDTAGSGFEALKLFRSGEYSLAILDWSLPDFHGLDVCKRIRKENKSVPVIMLTGNTSVSDRVEALDSGADDYLLKPFELDELLARLRALQRRSESVAENDIPENISGEGIVVNLKTRRVTRDDIALSLSTKEFDLLACLVERQGEAVPRGDLLTVGWGENFHGSTNVLDCYINYLRKKIDIDGGPRLIHTVRGFGYRFGLED